jgi:hypothetical protein
VVAAPPRGAVAGGRPRPRQHRLVLQPKRASTACLWDSAAQRAVAVAGCDPQPEVGNAVRPALIGSMEQISMFLGTVLAALSPGKRGQSAATAIAM